MVDLFDYFQRNNKGTWYEKFEKLIESEFNLCTDIQSYAIYDEYEAQENIKELCQPGQMSIYGVDDNIQFILNCFYLWMHGYSIEQFPNVIARPKSLGDFAETEIRNYAFKNDLADGDTVRWATRRLIIDEFKWIKKDVLNNITPTDTLALTFKKIDTNSSEWQDMQLDKRIETLNNAIEYILRKGSTWREVPLGQVVGQFVNYTEFRKATHFERHANGLPERAAMSDSDKMFLIDYGVSILRLAERNLKDNKLIQ